MIHLETHIKAPVDVCFNLSRDIDLHKRSMVKSKEEAVTGTTSGLIGLDETVRWKAKHFGITMFMTVSITEMTAPDSFTDEMTKGPFKRLKHVHQFQKVEGGTLMVDKFHFDAPLGILGKMVKWLILNAYMRQLLINRNEMIRKEAENIS